MKKYKYQSCLSSADETLNVQRLSGRINSKVTANVLGFQEHDIHVLVGSNLLSPLGNPVQNATKYFAACEIRALAENSKWLWKATQAVYDRWKMKNSASPQKDFRARADRTFPNMEKASETARSESAFVE